MNCVKSGLDPAFLKVRGNSRKGGKVTKNLEKTGFRKVYGRGTRKVKSNSSLT